MMAEEHVELASFYFELEERYGRDRAKEALKNLVKLTTRRGRPRRVDPEKAERYAQRPRGTKKGVLENPEDRNERRALRREFERGEVTVVVKEGARVEYPLSIEEFDHLVETGDITILRGKGPKIPEL